MFRSLLVFCLMLLYSASSAQGPIYKIISDENGLPSPEVYHIFEDAEGFIWFMTDNGVVRYDGAEFKTFGKGEGLADPVAFEMVQAPDGKLWVRGFSGSVSVFNGEKFAPYAYNEKLVSLLGKSIIRSMVVDDDQRLHLSVAGTSATIDSAGNVSRQDVEPLFMFYRNVSGEKGLVGMRGMPGRITTVQVNNKTFPVRTYPAEENNGTLAYQWWNHQLYLSMDHSLFVFDGNNLTEVMRTESPIISMSRDRKNQLWLGFMNGGVWRFSKDLKSHEAIQVLEHSSVTAVHMDREGGYWFSTLNKGVVYIPNIDLHAYHLMVDSKLNALSQSNEAIYLGYYNGQVAGVDSAHRQRIITTFGSPVVSIQTLKGDKLLVSTSSATYLINAEGKTLKTYQDVKGIKNFSQHNGIYYGVNFFGVWEFSQNGELLDKMRTEFWTRNILVTDRATYLAGITGLYRYDRQAQKLSPVRQLMNGKISDLAETPDGRIIAATIGDGLFLIKDDSVQQFNTSCYFPSNDILSMAIRADELWLGTPRGLLRLSLSALLEGRPWTAEHLDHDSGLHGGGIAYIEFVGEKVLAFNHNSYSIVDTRVNHFATREVKFYFKNTLLNGVETAWTNDLDLSHFENNLEVDFGFISFNNRNIKVRHRPNVRDDWNEIGAGPIHYFALAPGQYAQQIEYSLDGKQWVNAGGNRSFVIHQAWYKSLWAFLVYTAVLTYFIGYIFQARYRRKVEQIHFQHKLKQERERISRDLHDNIGSRLATISLVFDKVIKENSIQSKNTEFVASGLSQAMVELRDTIWAIEQERITLPEFSDKIRDLLWRLRQNDIAINIDFETENLSERESITSTQAVNLFRIVQEALTNSVKHSRASTIFIKLCREEKALHYLAIQDNGMGFSAHQNSNGHYGLRNMKGRAEEIGAQLIVESQMNLGTTIAVRFTVSK